MKKKEPVQKIAVDKNLLQASILRDSFYDFLLEMWDVIIPEDPVLNWHLKYLCDEVQILAERVFDRKPKEYDLIINISPGSTKSTICSVAFPPWAWTNDPTVRSICGSYGAQLSLWLGTLSRKIVVSDKYTRFFPEIQLVEEQKGFQTNVQGGQRIATSTGGGITGMHGHFLIVDDPINPKSAVSDKLVDTANEWIDHTLLTRKVDRKITPLLLIMQRLSQKDPTGHLLQRQRDAEERKRKIAQLKKKKATPEEIREEEKRLLEEQEQEALKREEEEGFDIEKKSVKKQVGGLTLGVAGSNKNEDLEAERKWNEKRRRKFEREAKGIKDKKIKIKKKKRETKKEEESDEEVDAQELTHKFKHICLPAELTKDVQPEELRKRYSKDGLMDPKRLDRKVLEEARDELGEAGFSGQYRQNPIPFGGLMFKVSALRIEVTAPSEKEMRIVRFIDKAGSERKNSKYTALVKMGVFGSGSNISFWVLDVVRGQWRADERERIIKRVAEQDGYHVEIGVEEEPGSGGMESAENTIRNLAGYRVFKDKPSGEKSLRAEPYSVQVNNGNVRVVKGEWNHDYIQELKWFPKGVTSDQVDASSGAFNRLVGKKFKLGALNKGSF